MWDKLCMFVVENMATINFKVRSKKNPSKVYVRIKNGRKYDYTVPTEIFVNPTNWNPIKGRVRATSSDISNLVNEKLDILQSKIMLNINRIVANDTLCIDELDRIIVNDEIKSQVDQADKSLLVNYINFYIEKKREQYELGKIGITNLTKYNVIRRNIEEIQKQKSKIYFVKDVDLDFITKFEIFCKVQKKYMPNTTGRAIKYLKTVCRDARINGIETSLQIDAIKGYTEKIKFVILNSVELEQIEKVKFEKVNLDDARDWLLISCYTGQRVSDFLRFRRGMLTEVEINLEKKVLMIEFTQQKTKKEMKLPLGPKILKILEKRNGEFPKRISDQRYNENIKTVCLMAGLTQIVSGSKIDSKTKRKTSGKFCKYELITSHIGRRSFASNNYGKMPTPSIMYATGHSTEQMLLKYIGKSNEDRALDLVQYMQ